MKKSAKKMIDVGQSSKKPAKKVEAAFPSKKFSKKKSSTKIPYACNLSEDLDFGTKDFPINLLKKEGAACFKGGVEEEAINEKINEKMKVLEIKEKAAGDITEFTSRFRAEIRGFNTGADHVEAYKALGEHFGKCGTIEDISVNHGCAYIDFASLDSLNKALELDNTIVCGCRVAVMHLGVNMRIPRFRTSFVKPGCSNIRTARFRALVGWSGVDVIELEPHFKKCGEIAGIDYVPSHKCAWIDFTNEYSLKLALDLDNTKVDSRRITVRKYKPSSGGHRTRQPPSSWLPTTPNGQPIVARLISGPRD